MKKMKKLKKLSLENEMKKEAEQIEKKVREDRSLDDIKVSDEMEKELFNKIQDYEYDKRHKKVVRKKKKSKLVIGALAAVLILVCGSVMTSVGSKSYWKSSVENGQMGMRTTILPMLKIWRQWKQRILMSWKLIKKLLR